MKTCIDRRTLLRLVGATILSPSGLALAQGTATARILVGYPAGGTADGLARVLAPLMAKGGVPTIVENKPGAAGQLAADAVRQAAPDGLSLLLTPSNALSLVPHLYRKPMYDSLRDFLPVGSVCDHSFALAVPGSSPVKTVAEFIAWGKAHPDEVTFASPGAGSSPHFLGVMFGRETGVAMNHVPYKGVAPGLQDLIGGQVASTFNPLPTMLEYHRAGRIRILAVTNPKRLSTLPDVPTFAELKIPGLTYTEWYGVFVAARTPDPLVRRLEAALQQSVTSGDMAQAARRLEVEPRAANATALKQMLEEDSRRWAGIVKATGIQLDS